MGILVTVIVLLAAVAPSVLVIHLLNAQHDVRIAAFHYRHPGPAVPGPGSPAARKARGREAVSGIGTSGNR
ncbi:MULTISPECIES: hypothetical protein [Streptomyces]|uniref:hypothetical protein n=1 Tax=Streptomyces TaxID=1883 RepID=UPI0029A6DF98|nr:MULTISPECIES: hypothetical protein [unclassified Streptomyces]MDX3091904.1 hypothetical protein [Streptomyces sp. ME12-02E]MDX3330282.1 hypothetical protein [Streptomyces sp. ME02-6978a]